MRQHVTEIGRHVIRIHDVGPGLHVALRAAFCLAVPLVALHATDHLPWALFAGFGGLAAVYGRYDTYARRVQMQLVAGATLVGAMLVGTLVSYLQAPVLVRVLALAVVGVLVSALSFGFQWTPPGAVFAVFAAGACASVPATPSSFLAVLGVGGGTVLLSVAVVLVLSLRRARPRTVLVPAMRWHRSTSSWSGALVMGVAVVAGGAAVDVLLDGHWYWACIAAISAVTGPNTHARVARGVQRFLGTVLGVVLTAGLLSLDPSAEVLLVVAVLCQALTELTILRNYAIGMTPITVFALVMVHLASPEHAENILGDRIMETFVGIVAGLAVALTVGALQARGERRAHEERLATVTAAQIGD